MKLINKATSVVAGLMVLGSSVFAQSLADAKKAIDAEQYQKAKGMLKNLTVTQSTKDENYFYLGLVYVIQDYLDSAKTEFNKGLAVNPKSALNYVGLGIVARIDKNEAETKSNFDKAIQMAGKDDKPFVYVAKGYLIQNPNLKADPNPAIAVLEKVKATPLGAKDPEVFTTYGDAYRYLMDSNNAYLSYSNAQTLDPKSPTVAVGLGVLWKFANNFDDAATQFNSALAMDPNYGPAYRELAENAYLQGRNDLKLASAKSKEAVNYYKKYLDLTDRSIESRLRYLDFLYQAGDFQTLQTEADALAKDSRSNIRVYRYLAYAAYENKNYQAGIEAINTWMAKADPKRIIPRDYVYLGRLQMKTGQDSIGILSMKKSLDMDTTQVDLYPEMASTLYSKKKYLESAQLYTKYIAVGHKIKLADHIYEGRSYYWAFESQSAAAKKDPQIKPDSSLLVKADSAYSYVIQKTAAKPYAGAYLFRAYIADEKEPADRTKGYVGYAKPYYEKYVELVAPTNPTDDYTKSTLISAYVYLGFYYELVAKDDAKATDNFTKAKELDPANKQASDYFARHPQAGAAAKGK